MTTLPPATGAPEIARLRELLHLAPSPSALLWGPRHVFEVANAAYRQLVGREVLGRSVADALPEIVEQGFGAILDEVYRTGQPYVSRERAIALHRLPGGAPDDRVLDFVLQPVRDDAGRIAGIFVNVADATPQVRAAETLALQRRQYLEQQREAQEMISLAVRAGRMGAWARDLVEERVQWTPDLEALFGLPPGGFGGTEPAFLELVHPDDRTAVEQAVARAIETHTDYQVEFRFRHVSGEWRWMEGRGRAVYDDTGRPMRMHGIGMDVTERKRSELRLTHLIETAPVGIALSEPDGSVLLANDSLLGTLGYTREDAGREPLDWQRFTPPEYLHLDMAHMQALREGGAPPPFEKEFIRRDGSRASVLIVARFLPGEGERMMAFALDITERKRAEAALRRTEQRLSRLFETNLLGVIYFDLQGGVQEANDEFLRLVGYDREDLRSKRIDWARMTPPEFQAQDARAVAELRRTGAHAPVEKQYVRKDGARVWVLVGSAMIDGDDGVGFVLDLSGLKAADEALRNADRRKDEFLATLAHELRNPLAPIRNAVQLLRLSPAADPQLRRVGEMIERQVRHMVRLVDDLLDVSRITLGQINLRRDDLTLSSVLREAIEASAPLIDAARQQLTVDVSDTPLTLRGDPTRLAQVFQNILNNASKYTPAEGSIHLRAERERDTVRVSVRDTGIGIPRELQPRVFELFTRVHPEEGLKTSGLGIGLALARQLVELHGGTIGVESEGPARGSEFIVRLPLLTGGATAREVITGGRPSHVPAEATGLRVLVVDDNRDAAESLGLLLEQLGCRVECAFAGEAALSAVQRLRPELVLLDIGMPGMDGYEVARRLRREHPAGALRLVAVTGWGQEEDRRRAAQAGFDDHVTKPLDPERLSALLRAVGQAVRELPVARD